MYNLKLKKVKIGKLRVCTKSKSGKTKGATLVLRRYLLSNPVVTIGYR